MSVQSRRERLLRALNVAQAELAMIDATAKREQMLTAEAQAAQDAAAGKKTIGYNHNLANVLSKTSVASPPPTAQMDVDAGSSRAKGKGRVVEEFDFGGLAISHERPNMGSMAVTPCAVWAGVRPSEASSEKHKAVVVGGLTTETSRVCMRWVLHSHGPYIQLYISRLQGGRVVCRIRANSFAKERLQAHGRSKYALQINRGTDAEIAQTIATTGLKADQQQELSNLHREGKLVQTKLQLWDASMTEAKAYFDTYHGVHSHRPSIRGIGLAELQELEKQRQADPTAMEFEDWLIACLYAGSNEFVFWQIWTGAHDRVDNLRAYLEAALTRTA